MRRVILTPVAEYENKEKRTKRVVFFPFERTCYNFVVVKFFGDNHVSTIKFWCGDFQRTVSCWDMTETTLVKEDIERAVKKISELLNCKVIL